MRPFFILFLIIIWGKLFAQSTKSGTVFNHSNSPVAFAGVTLKEAFGSFERTTQTDSMGVFTFTNLNNEKYTITITHIGYMPFEDSLYLKGDTAIIIHLQEVSKQLSGITVTRSKPVIERTPDKVVYNVANSVMASGSNLLQAMSQLPGVRINNNDISIAGRELTRVMINNRLVQLQGEDLIRYLKSSAANEVTTIEVLLNPSAKYDVEGNAGLINIITWHSKLQGFSGNLQIAGKYYAPGESAVYGVHTFGEVSGSGNLSYNWNQWSLYGSFNHARCRHL